MSRLFRSTGILLVSISVQTFGAFIEINTNNAADVTAFQAGATVVGFDSLTGQNTITDGTAILAASQLDNQLKATQGIFFTSGGNTPIAVLDVSGLATARSAKNVIAPIEINTDLLCASGNSCFMEVFFTGTNSKFGAWFENGDARAIIFWTDNTSDTVDIAKGNFGGGSDSAKTIDHVTLFLRNGGPLMADDVTFAGDTNTTIPEPSTAALALAGITALVAFRKRAAR